MAIKKTVKKVIKKATAKVAKAPEMTTKEFQQKGFDKPKGFKNPNNKRD